MERLSDTSPEAENVLTQILRRMSLGKKWLLLGESYWTAKMLHAAGVRHRNPEADFREIPASWLRIHYGVADDGIPEPVADSPLQNLNTLREVIRVLNRLQIPYALGGAMASCLYGVPRYTRDADLTVEPFPRREALFASSFGTEISLQVLDIRMAFSERSSFSLLDRRPGFKVDVFIRKDLPFERSAMQRRVPVVLPDRPEEPIVLHTAEDTVLFKLHWYRLGNESSDQQWEDVLGVLKVQPGRLEDQYLDHWAADLRVTDLLQRARQESGS